MACDRVFGPRVDASCRGFDFTVYFEDIFLACLPNAVFLLLLPLPLALLLKSPRVVKRSGLLYAKLTVLLSLLIFRTVFLVLRLVNPIVQTQASLAADVLDVSGAVGAVSLSWVDHERSIRPSSLLAVYLLAVSLFDVARLRTLWLILGVVDVASVFALILSLAVAALVLESISKTRSLHTPQEYSGVGSELFSGLWTRMAYVWLLGTVRQGYQKILTVDDLPGLEPQLRSDIVHDRLEKQWATSDKSSKRSLVLACFRAYSSAILPAILPRLCLIGLTFAQPFMIDTLTSWIQDKDASSSSGKGMIGAYGLIFLGMASATALYWYQVFRFLVSLRAGLISMIYKQTVQARAIDLGDVTGLTLMGTDVNRIVQGFRSIHEVWASLLEIIIALYLLERQLQAACIVPGLLTLAFSLTTFKLSSWGKLAQKQWIEKVEKRLTSISSMLGDMKGVKMLGLTDKMFNVIDRLQKIEVETSRRFRKTFIAQIFISNAPVTLAPVLTFAVYVALSHSRRDDSILTSRAFTSLALISLLTSSSLTFIQAIPSAIQCFACFERIQDYCRQPISPFNGQEDASAQSKRDSASGGIELQGVKPSHEREYVPSVVSFTGQSFAWNKTSTAVLKALNFDVKAKRTTAVLGPTASGKSTLLQSIVGETISLEGHTERNFLAAAYCSQTPWLTNSSIRDNIVGACPLDEAWYASILHACALEDDIARLPYADRTKVGSNGVNLSGGQKQRLSLARALYSRCKFVLLDDVFSGLDAHTVETVAGRLFGQQGLFARNQTTVIIVTHSPVVLAFADDVVVLKKGEVVQVGNARAIKFKGSEETLGISRTNRPNDSSEVEAAENPSDDAPAKADPSQDQDAIDALDPKRKQGDWSVYSFYFRAAGRKELAIFLGLMISWTGCQQFSAIWLRWWSNANEIQPHQQEGMYLGVYATLGVIATASLGIACWMLFITIISKSMRSFHRALLRATLRAPLYFFNRTDIGSITNRFSQDMELVGMDFPLTAIIYVTAVCNCTAQVLILGIFTKYLAVTVPFVAVFVIFIQKLYLRTSRQIRLLDIEAKAPVFSHFLESASGAATIRAFGWQRYFRQTLNSVLDRSQRPVYMLYCVQQWLALILDLVVTVLTVILVSIVVTWRSSFDSGAVGLSLVMVMTFNKTLMSVVQFWTMLETSVGAVSRIKKYVQTTKPESQGDQTPESLPQVWPDSGAVILSDVVASHAPDGPPVLKGISLHVKGGEKVAICGRSGGGKTSLILSLLQMTSLQRGSIEIDGIDISHLAPAELRRRINVIPQDPVLIPGSIRFNIDPFELASDDDLIRVLEKLQLWSRIEGAGGLDTKIDTSSWSVGEKQLLCLARAIVRQSKLLILDEATSSVDPQTESLMQDAITNGFPGCTVLSVMHRLDNIRRFDKVVVLHEGEVAEYDSPHKLLAEDSKLLAMYKAGGYN